MSTTTTITTEILTCEECGRKAEETEMDLVMDPDGVIYIVCVFCPINEPQS